MTFHGQSNPPEDLIAARLFMDYVGTFVDIGAYDGLSLSNTHYFYKRGWQGVNLEPHPENYAQLCINQPHAINLNLAVGETPEYESRIWTAPGKPVVTGYNLPQWYVDSEVPGGKAGLVPMTVTRSTLTTILDAAHVDKVDYLSLDVDGTELDVLKGLDLSRWRPRLMIIEYNHVFGEMSEYLTKWGYHLARWNTINAFYTSSREDMRIVAGVR